MSRHKLAFDLDGTIADFGEPVTKKVADFLNRLGHIIIIAGGERKTIEKQTKLIEHKTIYAMREAPKNWHIDLAKIFKIKKSVFQQSNDLQAGRIALCRKLRKNGIPAFIGGRSTIDIMYCDKGHIVKSLRDNVIYFYDVTGTFELCNDEPAVKAAWRAVKTNPQRVIKDIKNVQKGL